MSNRLKLTNTENRMPGNPKLVDGAGMPVGPATPPAAPVGVMRPAITLESCIQILQNLALQTAQLQAHIISIAQHMQRDINEAEEKAEAAATPGTVGGSDAGNDAGDEDPSGDGSGPMSGSGG